MRTGLAVLQITRLDSSLLGFLSLLIPLYARTRDLPTSLGRAIPVLFICMCTFIANDLDDQERDRINHPNRPLASGTLTPIAAGILYFLCLASALFSTRQFVDQQLAFWYYGLLVLSISYGYLVEALPSLKAPYVAVAISTPMFIVAASYAGEKRLTLVACAGLLFALGRELCMDIVDRGADVVSFLHSVSPTVIAIIAFSSQSAGLALLMLQVRDQKDALVVLSVGLVLLLSAYAWFGWTNQKAAYRLMKLQFAIGLYFLT